MTKRELEKFICERKRNYNSLLRKFNYQPKMSRYLKELIKDRRIVSRTEIRAKGGSQMVFSRGGDYDNL